MINVVIGSDHAGYELKEYLKSKFSKDIVFDDVGTHTSDSCDYPDFAHALAKRFKVKDFQFGVLICGSAIGVSITANRYPYIRAATCFNAEITKMSRLHNNANIICLPARFVSYQEAEDMLLTFMKTPFEGGRHKTRVDKI